MSDMNTDETTSLNTTCCIVGGGPAGIMLGYLLGRAGVDVIVLEKHDDFLRDFRGDTIHPSTLELISELGLLEEFLSLPHQKFSKLKLWLNDEIIDGPDFSHLPTRCKYIALMPQWDFLDFLTRHARKYSGFQLMMGTKGQNLIEEDGRVVGVKAVSESKTFAIRADLVVGADGRGSTVRMSEDLTVNDFGVPIDVLWYRIPKKAQDDSGGTLGRIKDDKMMVILDRGDYYQCGTIIPKGAFPDIQQRGLDAFRDDLARLAPFLKEGAEELTDWNQVRLLTVQINRLRQWYRPGLLCIGDAAHAMSPSGGVGINLAVQDAVAAANLLAKPLREKRVSLDDLRSVQKRREWPAKMTQAIQVRIHRRMFVRKGQERRALSIPAPIRLMMKLSAPLLRRIAARVIGIGFRPEHIETPEVSTDATS